MFYYLSIPYNSKKADPDEATAEVAWRMEQFWNAVAYFIRKGSHVWSPMTLEPAVRSHPDIPRDWAYWAGYSNKLLHASHAIIVLCLPGWEESTGVQAELTGARELGLPIGYMTLNLDGTFILSELSREPIDYKVLR